MSKTSAPAFKPSDPRVAEILREGQAAQNFTEKARTLIQAGVDRAAQGAKGQTQFNALADILEGIAQGYRRLADLCHKTEGPAK